MITVEGHTLGVLRDPDTQHVLSDAHTRHVRPLCTCRPPGIPMYVASTTTGFVIKRMPGTGEAHAPDCTSWEPPAALSGLGQVLGEAITDNPDTDSTTLRLGFSLSMGGGRAAPEASGDSSPESVATDGAKLTLRALLHYLWDEAGFSSWSPKMEGKRHWRIVSWHLRRAADGKVAKRQPLGAKLYIPEPFDSARAAQISSRRLALWRSAQARPGKPVPLMLLIGEVEAIEPARYGQKVRIKHVPDAPFLLPEDAHRRLRKHFADVLEQWEVDDASHLMMVGTFAVSAAGIASLHQLAVMLVDERWLPVDSATTGLLIATAASQRRRFRVGMRYNLPPDIASAALIFTDTTPATAAFLSTTSPTDILEDDAALDDSATPLTELVRESGMALWEWNILSEIPALPAPRKDTHDD